MVLSPLSGDWLRTGRWTQLSWGGATLLSSHAGRFSVSGGRHINRKPRPLGFGHLLSEPDPPDRGGDGDTHPLIAPSAKPTRPAAGQAAPLSFLRVDPQVKRAPCDPFPLF